MARSKTELAKEAMTLLGLIDAQEEPSSEDAALIKRAYDDKFEELTLRELTYWTKDFIPNAVFRAVSRIIAEDVAPSFGKQVPVEFDDNGNPVSMGTKGLFDLKRVISRERSGLPTVGTYF